MRKTFRICILLSFSLLVNAFSYASGRPTVQIKRNKDSSLLKITQSEVKKKNERHISIYLMQNSKSKPKLLLELTQDTEEAPTGGAGFIDIDKDGFYEVEVQGMCGAGPNCESDLYKLDRESKTMYHFFTGGYESIFILEGYLIESGRDGCCAWEYHAYKIENDKKLLSQENMSMMITVRAEGDDKGNITSTECTFSRPTQSDFEVINPPSKNWLKLCEHFDKRYKLVKP